MVTLLRVWQAIAYAHRALTEPPADPMTDEDYAWWCIR